MSDVPADSPHLPSEGWSDEPRPREGWNRRQFLFLLVIAVILHVALIIVFGTKKPVLPEMPRPSVPHLQLVGDGNELIALGDPTLFARPNARDLVSVYWRHTPAVSQPDFNWTEEPRYLPPAAQQLGFIFREFMRVSQPAEFPLTFKPAPKLTLPVIAFDKIAPQASAMKITGDLAARPLLTSVALPSLPWNDALAPSKVQALVDPAGNVFSAVLLPLESVPDAGTSAAIGDSNALAIARSLRFAPAPGLTFGEIIFRWHTVPMTSTNTP
jgi:hypothetical protein